MSPSRRHLLEDALTRLAPALPAKDRQNVIEHALWSKGLRKAAPETAVWLALVSFLRHAYTDYDQLLADGYEVEEARYFCMSQIIQVLEGVGCKRRP